MLKPKKLRPGDAVAAVSLSWGGPGTFPHRYAAGKQQLTETFGLHVVETPHALKDAAWIARRRVLDRAASSARSVRVARARARSRRVNS